MRFENITLQRTFGCTRADTCPGWVHCPRPPACFTSHVRQGSLTLNCNSLQIHTFVQGCWLHTLSQGCHIVNLPLATWGFSGCCSSRRWQASVKSMNMTDSERVLLQMIHTQACLQLCHHCAVYSVGLARQLLNACTFPTTSGGTSVCICMGKALLPWILTTTEVGNLQNDRNSGCKAFGKQMCQSL